MAEMRSFLRIWKRGVGGALRRLRYCYLDHKVVISHSILSSSLELEMHIQTWAIFPSLRYNNQNQTHSSQNPPNE